MGSASKIQITGQAGDLIYFDKSVGRGVSGSQLLKLGHSDLQIGDVGNGRTLTFLYSKAGGDSPKGFAVVAAALGGAKGLRQGAANIGVTRTAVNPFIATWDGNPDTALKMLARNYGNNLDGATRIGGQRALDIQARNSGNNLSWVKTMELNARNDSGKNVSQLAGLHIRCENYGNIYTDNIALDVEMSDENTTQSQERIGVQVRNSDGSGMPAVNAAFKIKHTSTNGFTNFLKLGSATGDSYTAKATAVAALGSTLGYLLVDINGTPGRIPVFDTWA